MLDTDRVVGGKDIVMRAPLHLYSLSVLGALALGCSGGSGDTGEWWPTDSGQTGDYFEPTLFWVETYAAFDGERLDQFILDPNDPASALPPVMMLTLAEDRFWETGNEAYTCSWFGVMNVEGWDLLDDPELWAGYAISLSFLETDCTNLDPWVWGERSPTSMLERSFLGVGYRPMSADFEAVIKNQVSDNGLRWAQDWEPYVFTMVMGLWDEDGGKLIGTEVDYAFAYKMVDGALSYDLSGNPIPMPLSEAEGALPQGLVAGYPYFQLDPVELR